MFSAFSAYNPRGHILTQNNLKFSIIFSVEKHNVHYAFEQAFIKLFQYLKYKFHKYK